MPRIVIDDREIEVPAGTRVIEAAERLGIMIPRFCYHEALGSVGACRMCAVKFLQGPFKGVQMSCMIDAQDGMVVSTTDPEAVDFRRHVIEWLMLNHPHDCPVCDEGGQCLLQDETVSGGHGLRRFQGRKRTYRDQDLGPFIAHEMNRCIHCYRCARFYQDFAGYRDLGPMQSANRVYFGRFKDGALESPFSGNLVDICPTGVFTDKPARYRARRWDLERSPSLCLHCSLGCNVIANARYREVLRIEGRFSEAVNGHFICDRGRFGFAYASHPDRPRKARIGPRTVPADEAVKAVAARLAEVAGESGPGAVALLGSARNSLETQAMLVRLARLTGCRAPVFFVDDVAARNARRAVSALDSKLAVSLREIRQADLLLAVGVDPVSEAPMLAIWMRQAFRKEARVAVLDPRPVALPFDFTHLPVPVGALERALEALRKTVQARPSDEGVPGKHTGMGAGVEASSGPLDGLEDLSRMLAASRKPVIVCGTGVTAEADLDAATRLARALRDAGKEAGLFFVLPGPNAFGAVLAERSSEASGGFAGLLEAMESGRVRALVAVESDPLSLFHDGKRLEAALAKLEFLVAADYLPTDTACGADIFLPTATVFERGGTFINQEGRAQAADPVHSGGAPIRQVSSGGHPPRSFQVEIPGGEHAAGWRVIEEICQAVTGGDVLPERDEAEGPWPSLWAFVTGEIHALAPWRREEFPAGGLRVIPEDAGNGADRPAGAGAAPREVPPGHLDLLLVDELFGTEELAAWSSHTAGAEKEPALVMHEEDARIAGIATGDSVRLRVPRGEILVRVATSAAMARGTLVLPRRRSLGWRYFDQLPATVPFDAVSRVNGS